MDIFFILQPVSCLRKQQVDKLQGKYNVEPFYYIYLELKFYHCNVNYD